MGLFSNISREGTGAPPAANYGNGRGYNERECFRDVTDFSAVWEEVLSRYCGGIEEVPHSHLYASPLQHNLFLYFHHLHLTMAWTCSGATNQEVWPVRIC